MIANWFMAVVIFKQKPVTSRQVMMDTETVMVSLGCPVNVVLIIGIE